MGEILRATVRAWSDDERRLLEGQRGVAVSAHDRAEEVEWVIDPKSGAKSVPQADLIPRPAGT